MRLARRNAAAVAAGGFVYVIGGHSGERPTAAVERYDPEADLWTEMPPLLAPRFGAAAAAFGGEIYVAGGHDGRRELASCERLQRDRASWEQAPSLVAARMMPVAVVLNNDLFVLGGAPSSFHSESTSSAENGLQTCIAALHANMTLFRQLSGVMSEDLNWDILQRHGEPAVCLGEGHRHFFVLFHYKTWKAASGTTDFSACVPSECTEQMVQDEVLPRIYHNFFRAHQESLPDGSQDFERSVQFSVTIKEYKPGVQMSTRNELRDSVLFGLAMCLIPAFIISVVEILLYTFSWMTKATSSESKCPLLMEAFSLRSGWRELTAPGQGECADLCRLRVTLVAALLTLHITQGSKWRYVEDLEKSLNVFAAVRPLALVNDAFILLSAYLCAWSSAKAEVNRGPEGSGSSLPPLASGLIRSVRKYLRQLPVCLLWAWVYLIVLPLTPYNPYNHAFPWFGIRWYSNTGRCMQKMWRYSLLLGDVGAMFFQDGDENWLAGNGNPCANLWNFQLEIQVFFLASCLLALPRPLGNSVLVAIVTFGFSRVNDRRDPWWVHHSRGVSVLLLFLRALGLPHVRSPPGSWRKVRWLGTAFVLVAAGVHGVSRGDWLEVSWPEVSKIVQRHRGLATAVWQVALAGGLALICEGCRSVARHDNGSDSKDSERPNNAQQSGQLLAVANRLAFGINVAHPFVQFYVEAHSSLNERVYSVFSGLSQLFMISLLSAVGSFIGFLLVQRPWALIFSTSLDYVLGLVLALVPGTKP
ncbi:unnamed protein product [Polarella glacialis]|uniref:Uncharacterized protein n=1 Tax=Polarella glacialis TaxID=89957 RepID=A0A813IRW7_POLGL|nr:unnamed protein product [Polarella glacialis]